MTTQQAKQDGHASWLKIHAGICWKQRINKLSETIAVYGHVQQTLDRARLAPIMLGKIVPLAVKLGQVTLQK